MQSYNSIKDHFASDVKMIEIQSPHLEILVKFMLKMTEFKNYSCFEGINS